jgi:hypothetical protein
MMPSATLTSPSKSHPQARHYQPRSMTIQADGQANPAAHTLVMRPLTLFFFRMSDLNRMARWKPYTSNLTIFGLHAMTARCSTVLPCCEGNTCKARVQAGFRTLASQLPLPVDPATGCQLGHKRGSLRTPSSCLLLPALAQHRTLSATDTSTEGRRHKCCTMAYWPCLQAQCKGVCPACYVQAPGHRPA